MKSRRSTIHNLLRKLTAKPECLETDDVAHPDPRLFIILVAVGMLLGAAFTNTNPTRASISAQEKSAEIVSADVSR